MKKHVRWRALAVVGSVSLVLTMAQAGPAEAFSPAEWLRSHFGQSTQTVQTAATPTPVAAYVPVYSQAPGDAALVSLGDSIPDGYGLEAGSAGKCVRSPLAYPELVAEAVGRPVTRLECTGASIRDGFLTDQEVSGGRRCDGAAQGLAQRAVRRDRAVRRQRY